ncbi:hypothetical protein [Helicobacter cynogastricus]|uniref:hypothetical protein n=1 Tax=Helicobacter cynogastricus TaxID=329937 RepID=UPI000CF0A942|nr:hypothetical protein [Helicobacter cynogastricus]
MRLNALWKFFIGLGVAMGGLIALYLKPRPSVTLDSKDFVKIEVWGFKAFQTSPSGTDLSIRGSRALQYGDHEVLYDFVLSKYDTETKIQEHARGEVMVHKQKLYTFPKGVLYTTSSGQSFWSQQGVYDHKKQTFQGQGAFRMNGPEGNIQGEDIAYNHVQGILQARHVHAIIDMENAKNAKFSHSKFKSLKF